MIMKTTMKSAMKAAALLLMATVMTAGMTSCSNDDDNTTKTNNTVAGTVTRLTFGMPMATAKICTATVDYTDGAGVKHTEDVTGQTVEVTSTKLESQGDITFHLTLKKDAQLTEKSYTLGGKVAVTVKNVNAKGEIVGSAFRTEAMGVSVTKVAAEVEPYLATKPDLTLHYTVSTTSDGQITVTAKSNVAKTTTAKIRAAQ